MFDENNDFRLFVERTDRPVPYNRIRCPLDFFLLIFYRRCSRSLEQSNYHRHRHILIYRCYSIAKAGTLLVRKIEPKNGKSFKGLHTTWSISDWWVYHAIHSYLLWRSFVIYMMMLSTSNSTSSSSGSWLPFSFSHHHFYYFSAVLAVIIIYMGWWPLVTMKKKRCDVLLGGRCPDGEDLNSEIIKEDQERQLNWIRGKKKERRNEVYQLWIMIKKLAQLKYI